MGLRALRRFGTVVVEARKHSGFADSNRSTLCLADGEGVANSSYGSLERDTGNGDKGVILYQRRAEFLQVRQGCVTEGEESIM